MLAACAAAVAISSCGGDKEPQDADDPSGEFPVRITSAEFPNRQRLAQTSDLKLSVQNAGSEAIPALAVTISTETSGGESAEAKSGSPESDESFSVPIQRSDVAIPSRPVWLLENGYPKLAGETAPAGAFAAQTKTYSFGALEPGQTRDMVWRLVPVLAGNYTVTYQVAASLEGKAVATTPDGSPPEGEFVVRISDVPPQSRVDENGKVVPIKKGDLIGEAGSSEQQQEVGGE